MLFALIYIPSAGHAALCDDTDALKIVQETIMHSSQAGADGAQKIQPIQDIYKNKWLISCAVASGITNLDQAGDYLMRPDTIAAYQGLVQGGEMASRNIEKLGASMKRLAQAPAFKHSVVDRTRVIGLYILILAFLIGIAAKLYALILGADNTDPIDFALIFVRFITLLMFITFMKPLAFYGMQISSLVSNMLLDAPIQVIVSSNVGYTGPGALSEGSNASTPWFSSPLRVSSRYGILRDIQNTGSLRPHYGVDFAAPMGTRLTAPYTGTATCKNMGGYGLTIDVIPADAPNELHRVGHLSECRFEGDPELAEDFKKGKPVPVSAGQGIGLTGNSGRSTGPHVHVEARVGGSPKDPSLVYAVRSGAATPTSQAAQPGTGNPLAASGTQAGTNAVGTYSYEGNDSLTTDALFQEVMRLKSAYLNAQDEFSLWDFVTGGFQYLFMYIISSIARWIAGAVLSVLIILADVMMAITLALGPLVAGLTLIPIFENYLQNWIKGYITFLFYQPLAACFTVLSFVIMIVSMDTGSAGYLILVICYVMGCMKIPQIADGLSTSALIGVAMMMAFAPAMLTAKVAGIAIGAAAGGLAGGPAGALAGASAGSGAVDTLGGAASSAAGGAAGGQSSGPKASSGGAKRGFIKITFILLALFIGALMLAVPASAAMSQQEKKDLMNMSKTVRYPSPAMVNAVLQAVSGGNLMISPGGMTDVGDSGIKVYNDGDDDNSMNGIYNTSYCDAIDMPMTRFVLGKAVVDGSMIYELAFINSYNKKLEDGSARELTTFLLENGFSGNLNKVFGIIGRLSTTVGGALSSLGQDAAQLRAEIRAKGDVVTAFLYEAQQAIVTKLMFWVPIYVLILMFFIQIAVISYIKIVEPTIGEKASYISIIPRFIFFAIMIYFLKDAVAVCITFSNYISNAIVPLELQRNLMENITSKTGGLVSGYSLSGFMVTIFRLLTYLSIKILLMARDMFMTITVIVGPICIALGFFTRYRNPDQIHQFFTGWIENFVKLLFWGPLAAIMLFCLGILSVLTALDMLSVISVAVTAMAFLYAAGNIPNMAEKMSSVALGGLLAAMAPFMIKGLSMAVKGGVGGIFALNSMLYGLGSKMGVPYSVFSGSWGGGGKGAGGGGKGAGGGGGSDPTGGSGDPNKKTGSNTKADSKSGFENPFNKGAKDQKNRVVDQLMNTLGIDKAKDLFGPGSNARDANTSVNNTVVRSDSGIDTKLPGQKENEISDGIKNSTFLGQLEAIKGMDKKKFGEMADKIAKIYSKGTGGIENRFTAGESLSDLALGDQADSLIKSKVFDTAGLSGITNTAKTAFAGLAGLKLARSLLESHKNRIHPKEYSNVMEQITRASAGLGSFIEEYTTGKYSNMSEPDLAARAKLIAQTNLGDIEKMYRNALKVPLPVFMKRANPDMSPLLESKPFGVTKREFEGAVTKVSDALDINKLAIAVKSAGYSAKELIYGEDGEGGLINHVGLMLSSGLSAEPPSLRAALTGMAGVRTLISVMPEFKGKVNHQEHYRVLDSLQTIEKDLEKFITDYTAGGYKDISEDKLISHVISVTSGGLDSFDTLKKQIVSTSETAASDRGVSAPVSVISEPASSSGFWDDPVSFISGDIASVIPPSAHSWLSGNMRREGGTRLINDIRSGTVMPQMIFGAPVGSEESRSVFEGYGMEMPSDAVQNAAFQMLGLGVMREFASQAGSAETVTRIERSIASVGEIIRSGGADLNTPVIDNIYSTAENVRISDPAAYETRSAAEFYGERVHRSDHRQDQRQWEASRSFDDFAGEGYKDHNGYDGHDGASEGPAAGTDGRNSHDSHSHAGASNKGHRASSISSGRSFGNKLKDEFNILDTIVKNTMSYQDEIFSEIYSRDGGDILHIQDDDD